MPNQHVLTEAQKKLRLYSLVCSVVAAVMALCWQFEIISIVVAMPLTVALLLSACLLYARISDISLRRAKDRKTAAKVTEDSIG